MICKIDHMLSAPVDLIVKSLYTLKDFILVCNFVKVNCASLSVEGEEGHGG